MVIIECCYHHDETCAELPLTNFLGRTIYAALMTNNVTFLEVLKNLDLLQTDMFFISFALLPIIGLDSCPVRVYAIEGLTEFSK